MHITNSIMAILLNYCNKTNIKQEQLASFPFLSPIPSQNPPGDGDLVDLVRPVVGHVLVSYYRPA